MVVIKMTNIVIIVKDLHGLAGLDLPNPQPHDLWQRWVIAITRPQHDQILASIGASSRKQGRSLELQQPRLECSIPRTLFYHY